MSNPIRGDMAPDRENPILLYQMGKVGSTAIQNALESLGYSIGRTRSEKLVGEYDVIHTHSHEFARKCIEAQRNESEGLIITGVRDPLRRNVSAFF